MGFNPFRPARRSPFDVAIVIGTVLIIVALLVWAIRG